MNTNKQQYSKMVDKYAPKSKCVKNCIYAFLIGGAICLIGQILCDLYVNMGLDLTQARALTSVSLVFLSALLTAFHLYDDIAKIGGAGTLVPITGFANAVVSPAIEFKSEGMVLGLGAKMFVIAGPVIVYGILASTLFGVIVFAFHLY